MVPVVDLSRRGRGLAAQFAEAASQVSSGGNYLLGVETSAFESEFGRWLGQGAGHVVAVSSGAGAIQLALAGLGVGPGDEVVVPAFTAVPTAAAVCAVGAVPVPVDVNSDTAGLEAGALEAARTNRTKAVIVVHLYGRPVDLPVTDLAVIEDAAQAHGAIRDHARSSAVAYSFYPTKNLGGIGDGGAVVTNDAALAERVRRLRVHGMTAMYVHEHISQNFRMSEIEAAWLRLGLPRLTRDNGRRQAIAAQYRAAAPHLRWQTPHPDHVHHLCVLRSSQREQLRAKLAECDVATAIHYPLALTQQPAFAGFGRHRCPNAEAWAAECMTLPCFPELTDAEIEHVAASLVNVSQ